MVAAGNKLQVNCVKNKDEKIIAHIFTDDDEVCLGTVVACSEYFLLRPLERFDNFEEDSELDSMVERINEELKANNFWIPDALGKDVDLLDGQIDSDRKKASLSLFVSVMSNHTLQLRVD